MLVESRGDKHCNSWINIGEGMILITEYIRNL